MPASAFRVGAAVFFILASATVAGGAAVTPVQKVIELLKKLEGQISEEGAKEAAQYDRYACFCREQADNKQYAIEKSEEKIKKLSAEIEQLEAEIAELNGEIADLGKKITELEGEIKKEVGARKKERAAYTVEAEDLAGAITAVADAITALKTSKAMMEDAKLDFAQLRSRVDQAVKGSRSQSTLLGRNRLVTLLEQDPHAYEYKSNDIIATLQGLQTDFKQNKKELDEAEFAAQSAHEAKLLGLTNEKKFAEEDKAEKEQVVGDKTEQQQSAKEDKDIETTAMESDTAFMDQLTSACEKKAASWDERSKTRSTELTAIGQAIEVLQSGVQPKYSANKKLVGLSQRASVLRQTPADSFGRPAFVQLASVSAESSTEIAMEHRAVGFLQNEGARLQSKTLLGLVVKVGAGAGIDHFVKVRAMIKDLIARLKADAEAEATTKSFCDKEMEKAIKSRDSANADIEGFQATISQKVAEKEELVEEIQALVEAIAELNKALVEATELRAAEKAGNEKTLADASAGKEAVEEAISILKGFYGESALLQSGYKPPNSDRAGKTVGDLAPETFEGEYKGKTDASKGIVGLLEVILSDFERTEVKVAEDEAAAQAEFEKFEADTKADIEAKEKLKKEKETDVATLSDEIAEARDGLADAKTSHEGALEELEKLKPMCVESDESWEERKERREQEIEALKQAMRILDEWKN